MLTKEKLTAEKSLDKFFQPKSIAIIGASQNPAKVGNAIVRNLLASGYSGKIYPVNPKEEQILDLKCYPSLEKIPGSTAGDKGKAELAVIAIPAPGVLKAVQDCAKNGIRFIVVITAGFKETGLQGAELEKELVSFCLEHQIQLVGPNCLGLTHTHTPLNISFGRGYPLQGNVTFISQSGAILTAILGWSEVAGIGFSHFVSLGNKAVLQETDFLSYAATDPSTKVILCYLEDITDGQRFLEVATRVSAEKPIVVLKAGSSPAGAKAASSHTGALAGADHAYEAAFRKSGVLRAGSMEDLFDLAAAFAHQPLPAGNKIAVVTNSGGPGILTADQIEEMGLQMSNLTAKTTEQLRSFLPPEASVYNPVDILGDAGIDRFSFALKKVLDDPQVDGVIVLACPPAQIDPLDVAQAIDKTRLDSPKKPLLAVFMGGKEMQAAKKFLQDAEVPCYAFPERAVTALEGMVRYAQNKAELKQSKKTEKKPAELPPCDKPYDTLRVKATFYDALKERRLVLLEHEGAKVLEAFEIPIATTFLAKDPRDAARKAEQAGFPVVLKIASPKILHKSDIGGVVPNLNNVTEVENSFREIMQRAQRYHPNAPLQGITVQKMLPPGMEIIIGSSVDIQFGPLLVFGLGGIYVNLFEDVSMRLAQNLSMQDIEEMIQETKAYRLLKGFRGSEPLDLNALKKTIFNTAQLVSRFPEIKEMDINPLLVYEKGVCAVDVKITLSHSLMNQSHI